jgi:hypothetical protein
VLAGVILKSKEMNEEDEIDVKEEDNENKKQFYENLFSVKNTQVKAYVTYMLFLNVHVKFYMYAFFCLFSAVPACTATNPHRTTW